MKYDQDNIIEKWLYFNDVINDIKNQNRYNKIKGKF